MFKGTFEQLAQQIADDFETRRKTPFFYFVPPSFQLDRDLLKKILQKHFFNLKPDSTLQIGEEAVIGFLRQAILHQTEIAKVQQEQRDRARATEATKANPATTKEFFRGTIAQLAEEIADYFDPRQPFFAAAPKGFQLDRAVLLEVLKEYFMRSSDVQQVNRGLANRFLLSAINRQQDRARMAQPSSLVSRVRVIGGNG
ncbi:hypothetical protein IFO70_33350 [Phormidium tenue FACHB-886]|nr:hypothetical protein [Phormidium tenue FACHB-886]